MKRVVLLAFGLSACAQMAGFYDLPNSVPAGMTDSR